MGLRGQGDRLSARSLDSRRPRGPQPEEIEMAELEELSTGRRLPLGFRQVLGRGPTADLRLLTPGVSSLHASLAWDGLQWRLRDLGSRNGTALNGEVCRAGEDRSLSAGATFALGAPHASSACSTTARRAPRPAASAPRSGPSGRAA